MIESFQTIFNDGECSDQHQSWPENAIEDYMRLKDDVNNLISLINDGDLSPLSGTGSPEGSVEANYSLKYIDTSVPTEYFNETFGASTGWIAL